MQGGLGLGLGGYSKSTTDKERSAHATVMGSTLEGDTAPHLV